MTRRHWLRQLAAAPLVLLPLTIPWLTPKGHKNVLCACGMFPLPQHDPITSVQRKGEIHRWRVCEFHELVDTDNEVVKWYRTARFVVRAEVI